MSDKMIYTIYKGEYACRFCDEANKFLENKGLLKAVKVLSRDSLMELAGTVNMNTVPIIYHGHKLIGGYTELVDYVNNNR